MRSVYFRIINLQEGNHHDKLKEKRIDICIEINHLDFNDNNTVYFVFFVCESVIFVCDSFNLIAEKFNHSYCTNYIVLEKNSIKNIFNNKCIF